MDLSLVQILPDWAPNIHPMLVHFPIAIFFFAALMDLLSFVLPMEWWGQRKTAITYLIGAISVIIVFYTGKAAAGSLDIPKSLYHDVGMHAGWAHWTFWFFIIYGIVRFVLTFFRNIRGIAFHVVMFLISLVGLYFLFETGEHGAKLVFGHGLGTGQLSSKQTTQVVKPQSPGFKAEDDGTINWIAGKDAAHSLTGHVTFLQGNASSLKTSTNKDSSGSYALQLQSPKLFFVTDSSRYSSVQMELEINPADYKGDIVLAHNVHDAQNYAYMVLHPDGSAQLGRYEKGEKSTVKKGSFNWEELKQIKLAVSGDHIHGYVNGEQILHGHSEQTGPGAVGLKLDGNGTFGLSKMKITPVPGEEHEEHSGDEHGH